MTPQNNPEQSQYKIYDIDEIKKRYQGFSDIKIKRIARNESKQLRPEIREILKDEIQKRKLNKNLLTWIYAENDTLTDFEKQSLFRKIENLKCPNCNKKRNKLIAQEFNTVVSVILWCKNTTQNKILCHYCSKNLKLKSFLITILTGWWSRTGFLLTPYTLAKNIINLFYQRKINNRIISEFIEYNNGIFRLYGTDDETVFNLISRYNDNDLETKDNSKEKQ